MDNLENLKIISRSSLIECVSTTTQTLELDVDVVISRLESFILAGLEYFGQDQGLDNAIRIAEQAIAVLLPEELNMKRVQRGRPAIQIDLETVKHLLSMNFRGTAVAKMFGISTRTLYNKLRNINYSVKDSYSPISRHELGDVVHAILLELPNTGYKRMRGFLLQRGLKVPESKVREVMREVDPQGVFRRATESRVIVRRVYFVEFSNDLWHLDTNLKLVSWKIVVRGGIDGKSRVCTYLEAGSNNTSESNYYAFRDAAERYGIPSRCRSDKGRENLLVARFMLESRGTGRGSHICGRSVHNQRIERFWRDVRYGCIGFYKGLFLKLEQDGLLDTDRPSDLFALHYVMLPRLNLHLQLFKEGWNHHPLSSEGNKTPLQLMISNLPPPNHDLHYSQVAHEMDLSVNDETDLELFNEPTELTAPTVIDVHLSDFQQERLRQINPTEECGDYGYNIYKTVRDLLSQQSR